MRIGFGLITCLLVFGLAMAPSRSAPPGTPQTVPGTGSISAVGTQPRGGVHQVPNLGPVASALSANECTNLGGKVYTDPYGVCASKKVCSTTDNKGANHAVCLSVSAGDVW